jgi:hypothetical protein
MPREKLKPTDSARARVPMRSTGAETLVVGKKVLQWNWTEGVSLSCFINVSNLKREDSRG